MFRVGSASDIRQDPVWTSWQDVKSDPFFFPPPAANTTEMTVYFDKWEAEMCINYSWGEFKSRTQNTLQELNQKRTSHLSLQLSSDQSVSVHPVLQSLPLMLSNFITNYCVSSVSSNYIVFKCSALMEHLMKHVTRRCLCSQGFCVWEWVQINFGTVEEVETTHDGFRPQTLFTAVIQNSVQKVPRVIRTWCQRRRSTCPSWMFVLSKSRTLTCDVDSNQWPVFIRWCQQVKI